MPPVGEVLGLGDPDGDVVPLGDVLGEDGDTLGDGLLSGVALGLADRVGLRVGRMPWSGGGSCPDGELGLVGTLLAWATTTVTMVPTRTLPLGTTLST